MIVQWLYKLNLLHIIAGWNLFFPMSIKAPKLFWLFASVRRIIINCFQNEFKTIAYRSCCYYIGIGIYILYTYKYMFEVLYFLSDMAWQPARGIVNYCKQLSCLQQTYSEHFSIFIYMYKINFVNTLCLSFLALAQIAQHHTYGLQWGASCGCNDAEKFSLLYHTTSEEML